VPVDEQEHGHQADQPRGEGSDSGGDGAAAVLVMASAAGPAGSTRRNLSTLPHQVGLRASNRIMVASGMADSATVAQQDDVSSRAAGPVQGQDNDDGGNIGRQHEQDSAQEGDGRTPVPAAAKRRPETCSPPTQ